MPMESEAGAFGEARNPEHELQLIENSMVDLAGVQERLTVEVRSEEFQEDAHLMAPLL